MADNKDYIDDCLNYYYKDINYIDSTNIKNLLTIAYDGNVKLGWQRIQEMAIEYFKDNDMASTELRLEILRLKNEKIASFKQPGMHA